MFSASQAKWTQFGCGLCAPPEWLNFDASPTLRLQKLPIVGNLMPSGAFGRFPTNVYYGDIISGLPIPDGSVELLYCSHILEHLALNDFRQALRNCYRHLKAGGIFRLVVPDLECLASRYLESTEADAASEFMRISCLGKEQRPHTLIDFLRQWLGGSQHLWMWDYKSLSQELEKAGFQAIRRAEFGDSGIPAFHTVEDPDRWQLELGIQCHKSC